MSRRKNGMVEVPNEGAPTAVAEAPEAPLAAGEVPNEPPRKPPVAKFAYMSTSDTRVEACIWEEQRLDDKTNKWFRTFSVSFRRSYAKPIDGTDKVEWVESKSFRAADLPVLMHALSKAYSALLELKAGNYV